MQLLTLAVLVAAFTVNGEAGFSKLRKAGRRIVPKQDVKIKNPLKHSVGDIVKDADTPPPEGQEYDNMYVPVSPSAANDVSPSDPAEAFDGWEGHAAQGLDHLSASEGMRFEGSTCDSVCAACGIYAAQQPSGKCACRATCKMGECGIGGPVPHIGWSNNEVSSPRTMWQSTCNVGVKNCRAECMKDSLKKEIEDCKKDKTGPADCFTRLRKLNKPLPHDSRKQVHYCTRKGMQSCDTFMNVPQEGGWTCYELQQKCKEKVITKGDRIPVQTWEAPSVWKSVMFGH